MRSLSRSIGGKTRPGLIRRKRELAFFLLFDFVFRGGMSNACALKISLHPLLLALAGTRVPEALGERVVVDLQLGYLKLKS